MELRAALRPITSLIAKSEKAQGKLAPTTWQYAMLRDNLKALRIASVLMQKQTDDTHHFTRDDLQAALRAFAAMRTKAESALAKFSRETSQYALQRNRLQAFAIAEALVDAALRH